MDNKVIQKITKHIMKGVPNTYTFSKALAEALVNDAVKKGKIKGLVIRPSIVVSTYEDPVPGK